MPVKNVIKKTKTMIGKINPYYDMTSSNVRELYLSLIHIYKPGNNNFHNFEGRDYDYAAIEKKLTGGN